MYWTTASHFSIFDQYVVLGKVCLPRLFHNPIYNRFHKTSCIHISYSLELDRKQMLSTSVRFRYGSGVLRVVYSAHVCYDPSNNAISRTDIVICIWIRPHFSMITETIPSLRIFVMCLIGCDISNIPNSVCNMICFIIIFNGYIRHWRSLPHGI